MQDATPGVKLGIYECPAPYHRILEPSTVRWLASTGRFYFYKDTSRDRSKIKLKLDALKDAGASPLQWYNGNLPTLLSSLNDGGVGFSGIAANFYPAEVKRLISTALDRGVEHADCAQLSAAL